MCWLFRKIGLAGVVAALLGLSACGGYRPPVLEPLAQVEDRKPVVFLPGITGTRLRDPATGRLVWGNSRSLFAPRDGGYAVGLPIDRPDKLELAGPVLGFKLLGLFRYAFYSRLIEAMERNGYTYGDLEQPDPGANFFILTYDWRLGSEEGARRLAERLEALRIARGQDELELVLITQSDAVRIARYYLRFGDSSLEQALNGEGSPPARVRVNSLIMIGTGSGGALSNLITLDRTRRYAPAGRAFRPEVMFTFPALYEALPAYRDDLFVDEQGQPLDLDLYDASSWQRHRWSIFSAKAQTRVERHLRRSRDRGEPDLFGGEAEPVEFLQQALSRARQLQQLLARETPAGDWTPRLYSIQNAYRPTPERAMLVPDGQGQWRTLSCGDRPFASSRPLHPVGCAPGDGYATLTSQSWLTVAEQEAMARPPAFVPVRHRALIRHSSVHRLLLEYLREVEAGN